jgi:3-methyladenine DNA glycosylase AlkC
MAAKLKDFFDEELVSSLATELGRARRGFDRRAFVSECLAGLAGLELVDRGWHIAEVMRRHLPESFARAAEVLVASLGPELAGSDEFGMAPFRYLPHVLYVSRYGQDDFEPAMTAQYELTKRFSAEYSIRSFLLRHPQRTHRRLTQWATDANVHVRRLVSEGTRPRLPWAPRLREFQRDPSPVVRLLELLKDDPERYVARSVANNVNDIGKDHPDVATALCRRWLDERPERRWLVQHALRSLVKAGDADALDLLGFGAKPKVRLGQARFTPRAVRLGDKTEFSFEFASRASAAQDLIVDYAVHFVKANGSTRPKVFKLRRLSLAASECLVLRGRISFEELTTRRHYPGLHRVELLVNGVAYPLAELEVLAKSR